MRIRNAKQVKKLKMNLQTFAVQVFNPDTVMMHEQKNGVIPQAQNDLIIDQVIENSKIMQLGIAEDMDGKEKKFQYFAGGIGAYWVDEGQKIQTSKPKWLDVTMRAHKLGVILPVTREYLNYSVSQFFELMKPQVAEAFYKKFDEAGILNVNNPFAQSIEQSVIAAENIQVGPITYDNILAVEDMLLAADEEANAFVSKNQNNTLLRNAKQVENGVADVLYDRATRTIDGIQSVNLKSASMTKGTIYAGNFDHVRYGIPFPISYAISDSAQLSTVENADGTPVNLFEQEMVALRVTMDIGFMIIKDEAFAKLQPAAVPEGA